MEKQSEDTTKGKSNNSDDEANNTEFTRRSRREDSEATLIEDSFHLHDFYQKITPQGSEPEHQGKNVLPISSVGTANSKSQVGRLPAGSALKTAAGDLANGSIQAIIHAAPQSFADCGND